MDRNTIGRYEILGELGRGAMGSVLRGRDPAMGRVVAIKSIHATALSGDQAREFRERFYREARAAGALSHPGIIPVFDVGEDNGAPFLVMELVQGRTLDAVLKQGERYSLDRVCQIGQQLAEALGYAHHNGVIHRDIKPANILMTSREVYGAERPRITDFGVAKLAGGEMTSTGQLLGTPAFMPPEQFTGAPIDGRTDLFALGVILYRMTTGEQPFPGETLTAVSYKVVHTEPIPPSKLNPAVPPQLEAVILKCLAKNPTERYQTGEDLAADLGTVRAIALGQNSQTTAMQTHPIMDSGATETIDQVSSLRPRTTSTRTLTATAPPAADQKPAWVTESLAAKVQNWPAAETAASPAAFAPPTPHPDAFMNQPRAAQTTDPGQPARSAKKRPMLAVIWAGVALVAVAGTWFFLRLNINDRGEPVAQQQAAPAPPNAASAPTAQPADHPTAQPQPPQPASHQAAQSAVPSAKPSAASAAAPAAPSPAAAPAPPAKPAAGTVPGASTSALNFNPRTLDPNTSAHMKMNLDGFSAPLVLTVQMDGHLYWSGSAGDQKSYQNLLVPPGKHEFRVIVKGDGGVKTSNPANADFAAKKRITLAVKLRPQSIGGSSNLDPSSEVTAQLKKDLFSF